MDDVAMQFAGELNLVSATAICVIGAIVLLWPKKPGPLSENPSLIEPLWYWVGQWFCLIIVWLLDALGFRGDTLKLISADLQSVFAFGLCISFLRGKDNRSVKLIGALALIFAPFFLYDIGMGIHIRNITHPSLSLLNSRIAPSQVLSLAADAFLAVAFFLRYGASALPFVLACFCYAALQRPAYTALFVDRTRSLNVLLALAAGKVFLGSTFYALFFQRAGSYESVRIPVPVAIKLGPVIRSWTFYLLLIGSSCVIFGLFTSSPWIDEIKTAGKWLLTLVGSAALGEVLRYPISKLFKRD